MKWKLACGVPAAVMLQHPEALVEFGINPLIVVRRGSVLRRQAH